MKYKEPLWQNTFLVLAVLHVVFQFGWWLPIHLQFQDDNRDLFVYHKAAQAAVRGEKIYKAVPHYGPDSVPNTFLYPPAFAVFMMPLGRLSLPDFARLWYCVLIVSFWVYAATLSYLALGRITVRSLLLAGLFSAVFPGTMLGMSLGNAQPVVNALWGLAMALGPRGRGAALAAAALIKIHPLLSLLIAWKYERDSRWSSLFILVGGTLLGLIVFGVNTHREWWQFAQPLVSQASFIPWNVSLSFLPLRLWQSLGFYEGGPLPAMIRLYLMIIAVLAPLVAFWFTRRLEPRLQMTLVGCAAVLFAPLCWVFYLPMLMVPCALLIRKREDNLRL